MSDEPPARSNLPGSLGHRLQEIRDAFELAWEHGSSPKIEEYICLVDANDRAQILRELMCIEIAYRLRRGHIPVALEYECRFRDHAELVRQAFSELQIRDA